VVLSSIQLFDEAIRYTPLSNDIMEKNNMPKDSSRPSIKAKVELTTVSPSTLIPMPQIPLTIKKLPKTNLNPFMIFRPQLLPPEKHGYIYLLLLQF